MKIIKLYSGGGVSLSPEYTDGRSESSYIRLVADDGMMLKNGDQTTVCIDILAADADDWEEVNYIDPPDESTTEDKAEAYDILMGVSE